ncbi:uncharacterized protein LOC142911155 isoform X6 [Petromyzon marinus]|uniref:uncharacterized protein LOC142911155 isoform X6 n=1 Tax=Petromyzon marinus TaxID=7757 RepID=UPI003F70869E
MKPSAEIWAAVFPRSPTSKYAQANITEQHQPRQSTPPPPPLPLDGQENKDHVSRTYNSLRCEMNKLNMWKVRVHSELSKKEEAVRMAQETADALQKSTRQTQLENVHLSAQLQDVIDIKGDLMEKIRATRQMCDDLKGQSSSVQQTLTRAETEQEEVEAVHSSLKAELKTFAVTFSELNLKSQNDKNIELGKVEAAVEATGRARWDFVNKLTIKESQAKEMSELLELKNEELKMASQKLQDSIESCARLEETERNFQARLEQMQKESGTLKLEVNRRREIESTLQAGMQNAERSFAEKEREFTASTAGQRLSCDKLQHERRDLNVIVQNLEKANEELTAAASQRRSEEAEIRSRLERNIREKNTEIDNLKIASDNNDVKHRETLESLDAFKRERASLQEAVCQMEQRIAAMETLKNESKSELNGAKAKERVLENDLRDALNAANVLESELSQERICSLDIRNRLGLVILENEELTELFSRVAKQNEELTDIIETTKRNEAALQVKVQKLESINKNLTEELESAKTQHHAQLEAHVQKYTNLVHELDEQREAHRRKDSRNENKIKDLESEIDSLERQRQDDRARDNAIAELADYMEQIRHLEEIRSRNISAEIEEAKIRAEETAQFKITEMTAVVEEWKRECDRKLEAKDYSSLDHKYQEALERARTSNKAQSDEMRAEIAKLKEELKRKTPPLPAPATVANSASKGVREPLATAKMVNKKRKSPYRSDFESSEGMDLTADEQLRESASGAMPPKRTGKARAAGKNLGDAEGSGDSDDDDTDTIRVRLYHYTLNFWQNCSWQMLNIPCGGLLTISGVAAKLPRICLHSIGFIFLVLSVKIKQHESLFYFFYCPLVSLHCF